MNYLKTFLGKEEGEEVIYLCRPHWIIFVKQIVTFIVIFALPVLLYIFAREQWGEFIAQNSNDVIEVVLFLMGSVYLLLMLTTFYNAWLSYYLDVWLVTNKRVVNFQTEGFFSRKLLATNLANIQDAKSEMHGFWASLFHFGTVNVQTAGSEQNLTFQAVGQPEKIVAFLNELAQKAKTISKNL